MILPSGETISKDTLIDVTIQVAKDMAFLSVEFGEAYDPIKEELQEGEWDETPALSDSDVLLIAVGIVGLANKICDKLKEIHEEILEDLADEYLETRDW